MLYVANYCFQNIINKLNLPILVLALLQISCKKSEVEIPAYARHNWYANYVVDGSNFTLAVFYCYLKHRYVNIKYKGEVTIIA